MSILANRSSRPPCCKPLLTTSDCDSRRRSERKALSKRWKLSESHLVTTELRPSTTISSISSFRSAFPLRPWDEFHRNDSKLCIPSSSSWHSHCALHISEREVVRRATATLAF